MEQIKVLFVGAFGRGYLLSKDLLNLSVDIDYVDLTNSLGSWPSEDIEGPFGFFRNENLSNSDYDLLLSGDPYYERPQGFTFLLPQGPLEMAGPLTQYHLSKMKSLKWLDHYSQNYGSCVHFENYDSVTNSHLLSNSFSFKPATRLGFQKQKDYLTSKGIKFWNKTQVIDLSSASKAENSVEFQGELSGFKNYHFVVWLLSSEETQYYSKRLSEKLFNGKWNEPSLSWMRYRMRVEPFNERDVLPFHSVMISDIEAPWVHENNVILVKTSAEDLLDVWILQSNHQRFNKDYLHITSQRWLKTFENFFSKSQPSIAEYPQEYHYSYKELGPCRRPVFLKPKWHSWNWNLKKKLFFSGPEFWDSYFPENEKIYGNRIYDEIKNVLLKKSKKEVHP